MGSSLDARRNSSSALYSEFVSFEKLVQKRQDVVERVRSARLREMRIQRNRPLEHLRASRKIVLNPAELHGELESVVGLLIRRGRRAAACAPFRQCRLLGVQRSRLRRRAPPLLRRLPPTPPTFERARPARSSFADPRAPRGPPLHPGSGLPAVSPGSARRPLAGWRACQQAAGLPHREGLPSSPRTRSDPGTAAARPSTRKARRPAPRCHCAHPPVFPTAPRATCNAACRRLFPPP